MARHTLAHARSRRRCGQGRPSPISPGADVARVSPVPVQMWRGRAQSVPAQMWQGRAQSVPARMWHGGRVVQTLSKAWRARASRFLAQGRGRVEQPRERQDGPARNTQSVARSVRNAALPPQGPGVRVIARVRLRVCDCARVLARKGAGGRTGSTRPHRAGLSTPRRTHPSRRRPSAAPPRP